MITIDYSDYIHVPECSYYNHNFYKPKDMKDSDVFLLEVYHEDTNYFSFYLEDNNVYGRIHLGDCDYRGNDKKKVTIRKLGEVYT